MQHLPYDTEVGIDLEYPTAKIRGIFAVHRVKVVGEVLLDSETEFVVRHGRVVEPGPTSTAPDFLPTGIGIGRAARTTVD